MKNSKTCPKCSSKEVVVMPKGQSEGDILFVSFWSQRVFLTRYLCAACGYSEQWVDSPEDLARLREKFRQQP